eukprot:scaffold1075_cov129-Isochrysis_galbana.AAC.2
MAWLAQCDWGRACIMRCGQAPARRAVAALQWRRGATAEATRARPGVPSMCVTRTLEARPTGLCRRER